MFGSLILSDHGKIVYEGDDIGTVARLIRQRFVGVRHYSGVNPGACAKDEQEV